MTEAKEKLGHRDNVGTLRSNGARNRQYDSGEIPRGGARGNTEENRIEWKARKVMEEQSDLLDV